MKTITSDELLDAYPDLFIQVTDSLVALPTREVWRNLLRAHYTNLCIMVGAKPETESIEGFRARCEAGQVRAADFYKAERFDCEDFASLLAVLMRLSHLRDPKAPDAGLAAGSVYYQKDGSTVLHAITGAVLDEPGYPFVYAEPQNGKEVDLSESEVQSRMAFMVGGMASTMRRVVWDE